MYNSHRRISLPLAGSRNHLFLLDAGQLATHRTVLDGEKDPDVDELYPMEQLQELLRLSDYVVLAVPLTQETEKLIGEAELRAMRPNAYLVNIARGRVVDEEALIRALQ